MVMTHQPTIRVDQRVVLFLRPIEPGYYTPLGEDGVYEIGGQEAIGVRHRFPYVELLRRIEGGLSAASPAPSSVVDASVAGAPAVVALLAALEQRGIKPAPDAVSRVEFLSDAPGQAYRMGAGWLDLHRYQNEEAAAAKTSDIKLGLDNPAADWVAPPHAYRCAQVIALYFGTDAQVTAALTDQCGSQLAGTR
jgi:hypothetical protein